MVDSIVSCFVQKLDTFIKEEGDLLLGVDEQLSLVRSELRFIKSFLRDAERRRRVSHLVEAWVAEIRDVAYDAEDVMDAYILHLQQRKTMNLVRKIFSSWKKIQTLHKIGKQIEQINTRARRISTCRLDYTIDVAETTRDSDDADVARIRTRMPVAEEIDIVGFQKESTQILNLLKEQVPRRQVISIIGMGGLGKTALARMIYKHCDVASFFDVQVWLTVSQEYQARDILLSALKQVSGYNSSGMEATEELKQELHNQLKNKKYMVVIDDIWKVEAWDQISGAFPNEEKKGSTVMVTTRNKEVVLYADSARRNHIELRLLNEEESWELFCKKVFQLPVIACPREMVKSGKEIVEKCGGLPLAILVIGGVLMGKERTPDAWAKVAESVSWYLSQASNHCHQILILSYSDLPYYLKPCFLYLGLFPEDFMIDAQKLIRLWVADGFVEPRRHVNMEDVAEDYLEEMVQRSLIQVSDRVWHGGPVQHFRVHDLLRDLAITEGRKDRFTEIHSKNNPSASTARPRRMAIHSCSTQDELCTFAPQKLRCLLFFIEKYERVRTLSDGNKMLRVLDLQGVKIRDGLPKEIGKLVFLRYLGLRDTEVNSLPSSIGKLVELQTLDIEFTDITILPVTIWELKNLRHLLVTPGCVKAEDTKGIINFGKNLLTLRVRASIWLSKDGIGLSDVLAKHGHLRSLEVMRKLAVNTVSPNLKNCFPPTLVELTLTFTLLEEDPSDVLGSLPTLKALCLYHSSYTGREMVFHSQGFPQLQYLHLAGLEDLFEWRVEDGSMPVLRNLELTYLLNLKKLPDGLQNVTTLQKIGVYQLPQLEERIKENGEDWEIVKHIPYLHYSNGHSN